MFFVSHLQKLRKELEEKRRKEKEEDDFAHLTPEEKAAEKLRLQMLQEEEYTRAALDTLGLTSSATIDSCNPKTKEDFIEFAEAICKKVSQYKTKDDYYVPFLDELVRNLCAGCE
jgi:translation initiation factor 3 subunit J